MNIALSQEVLCIHHGLMAVMCVFPPLHASPSLQVSVTHCTHGVTAVSGRSVDLDPGVAREFTFQIRTYKALGSDYSCEVQLFDADYNLIQSAQVSFATNGTCFCYGICGCVVRVLMCRTAQTALSL